MVPCAICGTEIYQPLPGTTTGWFHRDTRARVCWWGTEREIFDGETIAQPELKQERLV